MGKKCELIKGQHVVIFKSCLPGRIFRSYRREQVGFAKSPRANEKFCFCKILIHFRQNKKLMRKCPWPYYLPVSLSPFFFSYSTSPTFSIFHSPISSSPLASETKSFSLSLGKKSIATNIFFYYKRQIFCPFLWLEPVVYNTSLCFFTNACFLMCLIWPLSQSLPLC